jgi:hypothetical protein
MQTVISGSKRAPDWFCDLIKSPCKSGRLVFRSEPILELLSTPAFFAGARRAPFWGYRALAGIRDGSGDGLASE